MSNQPAGRPAPARIDLRGAVDLGSLANRPPAGAPPTGAPGRSGADGAGSASPGGGTFVREVTDSTFATDVMEMSRTVPVVIDFWATWCGPCRQLSPILEALAAEYDGQFLLGKIDSDANPRLVQAFQVQSIPTVFAVVQEQLLPLFQGALPEPQVREVITQLLRVAEQNGVSGRVPGGVPEVLQDDAEPVEEPLPPLHQAAYDAIEADDLDGAIAAYEQALREQPADDEARLGLAQVQLMRRTQDVDPTAAREKAAASPADVDAAILVADLDILGGHVADAFGRLIDTVRLTAGDERDRVRKHLVELFEVVGPADPLVAKARTALASALF